MDYYLGFNILSRVFNIRVSSFLEGSKQKIEIYCHHYMKEYNMRLFIRNSTCPEKLEYNINKLTHLQEATVPSFICSQNNELYKRKLNSPEQ